MHTISLISTNGNKRWRKSNEMRGERGGRERVKKTPEYVCNWNLFWCQTRSFRFCFVDVVVVVDVGGVVVARCSVVWCIVYPISTVRVARLLPWRMTKQLIDLLHVWRCWCILTATTAIIKNKHTCSFRCGAAFCCRISIWLELRSFLSLTLSLPPVSFRIWLHI